MTDIDAIQRLISDYCFFTDDRDVDRLLTLMTPDFAFTGVFGDYHGHDGMRVLHAKSAGRPKGTSRHLTTNTVIDLAGETATARSYIVLLAVEEPIAVRFAGGYLDKFVKRGDRWFFAARHIHANPADCVTDSAGKEATV